MELPGCIRPSKRPLRGQLQRFVMWVPILKPLSVCRHWTTIESGLVLLRQALSRNGVASVSIGYFSAGGFKIKCLWGNIQVFPPDNGSILDSKVFENGQILKLGQDSSFFQILCKVNLARGAIGETNIELIFPRVCCFRDVKIHMRLLLQWRYLFERL